MDAVEKTGFLEGLNGAQREAVLHDAGPLVVLAGPGAGKTRVIVRRTARLVAPKTQGGVGAEPESVLAMAFTNKSAEELRGRLANEKSVGNTLAGRVRAETCHAFGRRLVRRFGDLLGLPAGARVVDSAVRRRLLRECVRETGLRAARAAAGVEAFTAEAGGFIKRCRTAAVSPERAQRWIEKRAARLDQGQLRDDRAIQGEHARLAMDNDLVRVYEAYETRRAQQGALDLDDFVLLPVRLMQTHAAAAAIVRDDVRHVIVDEFQDWNPAQIQLLRLLAPPSEAEPPDVCVVGDDDQAIYAFRGADDRAFERFAEHWKNHRVVTLDVNYRSGKRIVAAAQAIIGRAEGRFAQEKKIRPTQEAPEGSVQGVVLNHDDEAGRMVAAMVQEGVRAKPEPDEQGRVFGRFAVIARTHGALDRVANAMAIEGVPTTVARAGSAMADMAVQDLFAWMRIVGNIGSEADVYRLLARPPCLADRDEARRLLRGCRVAGAAEGTEHEGETGADALIRYLRERGSREPGVRRFLRLVEKTCGFAAAHDAASTAQAIVLDMDLAHADGLSGIELAGRVERLVRVLGCVRAVTAQLHAPGDVRAFLDHFEDLDEREQAMDEPPEAQRIDAVENNAEQDAVRLLTAHAAKGLEFDTVFVLRTRPGHGYPKTNGRSDDGLDPGLTGKAAHDVHAEERRLFYVAMTRAERTLVLLAKEKNAKKNPDGIGEPTKGVDYFVELFRQDADELSLRTRRSDVWLGGRDGTEALREAEPAAGRGRAAADAVRDARRDAVAALHDAQRPGLNQTELDEAVRRLGDAAARIAVATHVDERGAAPGGLVVPAAPGFAQGLLEMSQAAHAATRPMRGPLELSYTRIKDYTDCPGCFYVKHVLKWPTEDSPALWIGNAVHGALQGFYEERRHAEAEGAVATTGERLLELGAKALKDAWPKHTPMEPDAKGRVQAQLAHAWENLHDDAEVLELEREVRFEYRAHSFVAKLDRVDRMPGGGFRIVDYKSGKARKGLLEPKENDLQLCIYAMALRAFYEIDPDEPVQGVAEYWVLTTGERGSIAMDELRLDKARSVIDKAIEGMLAGDFRSKAGAPGCRGLCAMLDATGA